jgi:hypothetical protein
MSLEVKLVVFFGAVVLLVSPLLMVAAVGSLNRPATSQSGANEASVPEIPTAPTAPKPEASGITLPSDGPAFDPGPHPTVPGALVPTPPVAPLPTVPMPKIQGPGP